MIHVRSLVALLPLLLLAAGCPAPTLHPLATPQTLHDEPALAGDYEQLDPEGFPTGDLFTLSRLDDGDYRFAKQDSDDAPVTLRFVKLGEHLFAEYDDAASGEIIDPPGAKLLRIARLTRDGDVFHLWGIDEADALFAHPGTPSAEFSTKDAQGSRHTDRALNLPTPALQAWAKENALLFSHPDATYRRLPTE